MSRRRKASRSAFIPDSDPLDGAGHGAACPVRATDPPSAMPDFALDPRLDADTTPVTELALSTLRLARDARFPWLILVPRRANLAEIIDLEDADRAALFDEITAVSRALRDATGCDKLNVAALGNQVRQLHVHVIARFETDAAWPGPIWGSGAPVAYATAARDRLVADLLARLPSP